jgi:glycosyltransferase involved in cell wall biosynthesis
MPEKLLHIAIDASRTTTERITGTEHYARQLIRHIIDLNDESQNPHKITLYFRDTPPPDLFPPAFYVTHKVIPMRRLWTHWRFARAINQDKPDVTFVPAHTLPFLFAGRAVVTVHDLGYLYFPKAHTLKQQLYLRLTTRYSAMRAHVVLADSQATADDLHKHYHIRRDKMRVVYPGVDAPNINSVTLTRDKYKLQKPYIFFIGTLQPRKNIERIVHAYRLWRERHPESDVQLVLAGGKGWLYDEAWVQGVPDVHLLGYIDDGDKGALLRGARCLLFPSLYEGFGFPVVEAMHTGTPVIASNTSSLPELVGDAGITVNPLDVNAIADALDLVVLHDATYQRLAKDGVRQARRFTWRATAESTLRALEDATRTE